VISSGLPKILTISDPILVIRASCLARESYTRELSCAWNRLRWRFRGAHHGACGPWTREASCVKRYATTRSRRSPRSTQSAGVL